MLDLVRLRVIDAVSRYGSVTEAAKALHYSQPSVSHHLARLEAETGAQLLQRVGRGVRLTRAGQLLADRAAEIIGRVDAAEAELSAHVGLTAGRVRLASFSSALGSLVPAAIAALSQDYPGLEISLIDLHPLEALELLRAGKIDVAVIFRYDETEAGIRGRPASSSGGRPDLLAIGTPRQEAGRPARLGLDRWMRTLPQPPALVVREGGVHAEDLLHHRRHGRAAVAGRRGHGRDHDPGARPSRASHQRHHRDEARRRGPSCLRRDLRSAARPAGHGCPAIRARSLDEPARDRPYLSPGGGVTGVTAPERGRPRWHRQPAR